MEMRRNVFQALADPTRREIIALIAERPMYMNLIGENFDLTRPAISNHLKILEECGIITIKQLGRERHCTIRPETLQQAFNWLSQFNVLWENRLNSFEQYVNELKTKRSKHGKRK